MGPEILDLMSEILENRQLAFYRSPNGAPMLRHLRVCSVGRRENKKDRVIVYVDEENEERRSRCLFFF